MRIIPLLALLLLASCQSPPPDPQVIVVTPTLSLIVDGAEITTHKNYTMLHIHAEWVGDDPRSHYRIGKPVITSPAIHKESLEGYTWYVSLPVNLARHLGRPCDLDIKNPPSSAQPITVTLPLIPHDSAAIPHSLQIHLPANTIRMKNTAGTVQKISVNEISMSPSPAAVP